MHADQLQVADDPATRIFPIVRPSHDVSDALLFERLLRLADHADLRNGVDEEKTRNGILSKRSVNPPRKHRMSFRQRSVTYVKSFLRAFTREKRYPTCFKFRFVSSPPAASRKSIAASRWPVSNITASSNSSNESVLIRASLWARDTLTSACIALIWLKPLERARANIFSRSL